MTYRERVNIPSYKGFFYQNEKLKESNKNGGRTICKTSYRNEWVVFEDGSGMSLYFLVPFVMEGQFYLTNPSKIKRWKGFRK